MHYLYTHYVILILQVVYMSPCLHFLPIVALYMSRPPFVQLMKIFKSKHLVFNASPPVIYSSICLLINFNMQQ